MRIARLITLALLALLLAGCEGEQSSTGPEADPPALEPSTTKAAAPPSPEPASSPAPGAPPTVPLAPIGLVDEAIHQEPAKDDWQGEVFNDLASRQFKSLGNLFAEPAILTPQALAPLLDSSFTVTGLVPAPLEEVFDDGRYLVQRPGGEAKPGTPADAVSAFREFLGPLAENARDVRTKVKIFGVSLDEPGTPSCTAWVQLSGHTAGGIFARRATWECTWTWTDRTSPPLLRGIQLREYEETLGRALPDAEPPFSDCTASAFAGLEAFDRQLNLGTDHWSARLEKIYGIGQAAWHGLALGDANGDGLDDLYVCEPGGLPNRLFIRKPDGTLLDTSSLSGVDFRIQTQSALFVDLDNDGDQDLALATTLGLLLLENDGRGNFGVKGARLIPEAAPLAITAADFDLDGDLDLYLGCYSLRREDEHGPQFHARPMPYHDANNGGRNVLFRNDRNWRFTNATRDLGLDADNRRFTLAASWEDYDDDGDPDLYVVNDFGRNCLYRNDRSEDGTHRFTNVAKEAGVEDISAGMSSTWSDVDGDGDRDLYVSNMWSSAGNRITFQRNFQPGADSSSRGEFQRHARGNSLFLNNGDGTFSDVSVEAGVTRGRWAWTSRFVDLNNDGWEDIVVANGFITAPDDTGDL